MKKLNKLVINMIKKLKTWVSSISWQIENPRLLLILPLSYISYIIYIRIILIKLDRLLYVQLSFTQILNILFILTVLFWRIYILLQNQGYVTYKEPKNNITIWIKHKLTSISIIFNDLWLYFYKIYIRRLPIFSKFMFAILRFYFYKLPPNIVYRNFIILFVFQLFPKIIVLIAFLLDIFYFYKFHYLYKVLWLLLLPLIFNTIKTLLFHFHEDYFPAMLLHFDITELFDEAGNKIGLNLSLKENSALAPGVETIEDFMKDYYYPLKGVPVNLENWSVFMFRYKIYLVYISFLLLYIIGWITILGFSIFFSA